MYDSYISVSVDNKNIFPNHKFKEDLILQNEILAKTNKKLSGYKATNNRTVSNTKNKIKTSIPKLEFNNIKKNKDGYIININKEIEKIKNNNNQTLSSIENFSNKELNENNKDKKMNEKEEKEKEENKDNRSTRIRVHKYNKDKSNIKIKIKNPVNPDIEYQQIEIKPGAKGYRVIKKSNTNKFRKNKNYINAKNKKEGKDTSAIKIRATLKPVKKINNKKINKNQNQEKNNINIVFDDNKSLNQNARTCDNQINIILSNKETHHMVGYERHFGKEENCPLCKTMKKKSQYMEEKIFGMNKKQNTAKQLVVNMNQTSYQNDSNKNQMLILNKKEEEKNLSNNALKELKDFNMHYMGQNKNRMKQNMFKDLQRKYSAKKSLSFKNMFKITSEQNNGYNRNNFGSFSDVEFPAINSYFHS